jgi:hypothetical protein
LAGCTRRTFCLVQCKVPSSSSGIACARHCSLSCWRSPSISSRIRWQNSLASRRRSPSRTLVCFLNNTTNPTRYQTHFVPLHRTTRAAVHDRNTTDTGPSNGFVHRNKHAIAESVPRLLALSSAVQPCRRIRLSATLSWSLKRLRRRAFHGKSLRFAHLRHPVRLRSIGGEGSR